MNENISKQWAIDNVEKVSFALWDMFSKSNLVIAHYHWSHEDHITVNMHKYDKYIFITDIHDKTMITLYSTHYDMDNKKDKEMVNKIIKEMNIVKMKIKRNEKEKKGIDADTRGVEYTIMKLEEQIRQHNEERQTKINKSREIMIKNRELKEETLTLARGLLNGFSKNNEDQILKPSDPT